MAELPYMQFFPTDWLADTRMITASAKGAWIDTLASLWNAPERGLLKMPERAWGRLWGVEPERIHDLLGELVYVGEIVREDDGITIASRRMMRDEAERERSRNSKRSEEKQGWEYYALVSRLFPKLFPPDSRKVPGDFPEDSHGIPGDIPETRNQRNKREREGAGESRKPSHRRPTLEQARSAAATIGITSEKAEEWWNAREASEWLKGMAGGGTSPVGTNWQADLTTYCRRGGFSNAKSDHREEKKSREFQENITLKKL